jgi:peroxiredoxin
MRTEIVAGAVFPDYELTDHTGKRRKLSDLQGPDPMILVLSHVMVPSQVCGEATAHAGRRCR